MHKKKKIFHIIQSLENGGCENMLLRTLPNLTQFDHEIIAIKNQGALAPQFESVNIHVTTVRGLGNLRTYIKNTTPDIVITYLFHADMIGRLFLQYITTATVIPFLRTTYNHPKYFIARVLEWLTKPLVKQYLANSQAVKNFYVQHLGIQKHKITVIPNGIDIAYFDSIMPNPDLRKSLGITENDFVIICVANLHKNKGHQYLLEAFEQLSSREKLLLVGDGPERENLQEQIVNYRTKNNIVFLGNRSDVAELLKISNIFILPTLFEGMSNAIMEAMASGVPVITTDIPENREIITHNVNGILYPIIDSQSIADAIERLLQDNALRNFLTNNAKKRIIKTYSMHAVCNLWGSSINDIIH